MILFLLRIFVIGLKVIGMGMYKVYAQLWAWLARPGNVGYGSMTIPECTCGACRTCEPYIPTAIEDWDATFEERTHQSVTRLLCPQPRSQLGRAIQEFDHAYAAHRIQADGWSLDALRTLRRWDVV